MLKQAVIAVCPAVSFPHSLVIVSYENLCNLLDEMNLNICSRRKKQTFSGQKILAGLRIRVNKFLCVSLIQEALPNSRRHFKEKISLLIEENKA